MLYKAYDGLSESNTAAVIYDNRPQGFNRDTPLALQSEETITEDQLYVKQKPTGYILYC